MGGRKSPYITLASCRETTGRRGHVRAVKPPIGICSWSLQPKDIQDLVASLEACGISAVQLALDPVRTGAMPIDALQTTFRARGIHILSGMMAMQGEDYSTLESIRQTGGIVPDGTWDANQAAAIENARLARALGMTLVTFHAGFVPHEGAGRDTLIDRLQRMADIFGAEGVDIALETGQEDAHDLHGLLTEMGDRRIGVNFDPANMILYGTGEPIPALKAVGEHVRSVHCKDGEWAANPGQEWGQEVAKVVLLSR